jgi:hypothetical protein
MIDAVITDAGLVLRLEDDAREDVADMLAAGRSWWSVLADVFEPYSCNGSFTPFDAGDGNPFVGLTEAPCVAECMTWDDDGQAAIDGRLWFDDLYMTRDLLALLAAGETVTLKEPV